MILLYNHGLLQYHLPTAMSREPRNPEVVSIEALILERSRRRPSFGGSLVGSDTDGRSQTEAVDRPRPSQTKLERKSTDISDTGLKLDGDHIRAISMRRSLRQWGWIWRRPMYPMSDQGRRELLQWSQPASGYDAFLSHSWQTWGFWKYLALTLHSCRRWLLLWWSLWVSAAFLASYALDLPTYTQISPETPRFHCRCDTGPWVVVSLGFLPCPFLNGFFVLRHLGWCFWQSLTLYILPHKPQTQNHKP